MVKATALPPRIAPTNDTPATKMIPDFGVAERDDMKVAAMELASLNPLVKVNAKASSTVITAIPIMRHVPSAVFSFLLIKT